MRKVVLAISIVSLTVAFAIGQTPYKVRTTPKLPPRDALGRMNLVMAWNTRLTIDGNRDGIFSVQIIPGSPSAQIVAQTYAGMVYLFDADNGDLIWKTQIGTPFWAAQPAGYNAQSIFVTRRNFLHVINRYKGVQRVFTFDNLTKENIYGMGLSSAPSAAPIADEELLHVSLGDSVQTFILPDFERIDELKLAAAKGDTRADKKLKEMLGDEVLTRDSPQPAFYWSYRLGRAMEYPPMPHADRLSFVTVAGELTSINRFERGSRIELFDYQLTGRVLAPAGQYYGNAYVGSDDGNLYAFDIDHGRLLWRHLSGAAILQSPVVNDSDIYITPSGLGLRLLNRGTGRAVWTNRDATRFLAANDKFAYALDKAGRFFVLDGVRGSTLAKYDLGDWTITVANEWTDRVYLAANDGQIICLRSRDQIKPLVMKSPEVVKKFVPKKPPEEKKEEMKDDKKDNKKDADKKDEKKDEKKKDARILPLPTRPILVAAIDERRLVRQVDAIADEQRRRWAGR